MSSRNFADPHTVTRAIGRCEAEDAIPTGTRRRRRIPPPFRSYSLAATYLQPLRVCAAVQVSPILRTPPRSSRNLMEARFTTRTRRAPAASRWHQSRTGMSQSCAPKHPSNLAHSDGKRTSGWAHSRLELGAASAGRSVRTAQPASCMLVVLCMRNTCRELAAAGLLLESRCRRHVCAVPPRSCDSDHDCSPEWPPRAAVWHETRTRAAGMHAEYVWPCYVAQLPLCPRVSARLGVPPASCSADSQEISLLG